MEVAKERWFHWEGYNHDRHYTANNNYDDYLVQEHEHVCVFLKQGSFL